MNTNKRRREGIDFRSNGFGNVIVKISEDDEYVFRAHKDVLSLNFAYLDTEETWNAAKRGQENGKNYVIDLSKFHFNGPAFELVLQMIYKCPLQGNNDIKVELLEDYERLEHVLIILDALIADEILIQSIEIAISKKIVCEEISCDGIQKLLKICDMFKLEQALVQCAQEIKTNRNVNWDIDWNSYSKETLATCLRVIQIRYDKLEKRLDEDTFKVMIVDECNNANVTMNTTDVNLLANNLSRRVLQQIDCILRRNQAKVPPTHY